MIIFCCCVISATLSARPVVYAADVAYSNVLEDLRKDSNFDESSYMEDKDDYSLSVITLAESTDNDLFVYVFQPTADKSVFLASYINIAVYKNGNFQLDEDGDLVVKQYALQYANSVGGFFKYKVLDYDLLEGNIRSYEIVSIARPYIEDVDEDPPFLNVINHVAFKVGKLFTFSGKSSQSSLTVEDVDTISLTDQYVGFVRYKGGYELLGILRESCDSHFIAFNTDRKIDNLLEASVSYKTQSYYYYYGGESLPVEDFGEIEGPFTAELDYRDKVQYEGGNWYFSYKYEWSRIQRTSEFVKNFESENIVYTGTLFNKISYGKFSDEAKEELSKTSWVLSFAETDLGITPNREMSTLVSNVTVLRLKFETDGKVYNLGAVSNVQTGSSIPAGSAGGDNSSCVLSNKAKLILAVLFLVLLGIIFSPILTVFKFLWSIIKMALSVVFFPFRLIFGSGRRRRRK